eukprot:gnl/TRDRNA2_/TRDRNA2_161676_c0_seq1.p1 gnl/TRDRNA2_/TRDRNA2_161676_c0~~gnl/TRDRNA2_/TRDRNA2_161676_c0_seq1.p1  ORF type:complete len:465 (+),score=78.23 gnl/TRDRNA2_/TRDRNA2_161676_c0_seq1:98-1396(+)
MEVYMGDRKIPVPKDDPGLHVFWVAPKTKLVRNKSIFDTRSGEAAVTQNEKLAQHLAKMPAGAIAIVAVRSSGLDGLNDIGVKALQSVGATISVGDGRPGEGYALIGVKGKTALAEQLGGSNKQSEQAVAEVKFPAPAQQTVREQVSSQLTDYRDIVTTDKLYRVLIARDIFMSLANFETITHSAAWALYGYSQAEVSLRFVPLKSWTLLWTAAIQIFYETFGELSSLYWSRLWLQFWWIGPTVFIPWYASAFWLQQYMRVIGLSVAPMEMAILQRCFSPDVRVKAMMLIGLHLEFFRSLNKGFYPLIFDAAATTYWGKGLPFFIAAILRAMQFAAFWIWMFPIYKVQALEITKERLAGKSEVFQVGATHLVPTGLALAVSIWMGVKRQHAGGGTVTIEDFIPVLGCVAMTALLFIYRVVRRRKAGAVKKDS